MAEALPSDEFAITPPDISHLIMENNEPVNGTFSERQMRLLVDPLYDSWKTDRPFVAQANVAVFMGIHDKAVVPDVLLSVDVKQNSDVFNSGRSYLCWEYGKPPDVVIEVVSNRLGGEEAKLERYTTISVPYVAIYDPEGHLSSRPLRVWGHHLKGYVEHANPGGLPDVGLGLTLWTGLYQGVEATWLRWCHPNGPLVLLGSEVAEAERERAEAERARADRLAARLRELCVEDV